MIGGALSDRQMRTTLRALRAPSIPEPFLAWTQSHITNEREYRNFIKGVRLGKKVAYRQGKRSGIAFALSDAGRAWLRNRRPRRARPPAGAFAGMQEAEQRPRRLTYEQGLATGRTRGIKAGRKLGHAAERANRAKGPEAARRVAQRDA